MIRQGCEPNAVSYSTLIHGLCEGGRLDEGMMAWRNMLAKGCSTDVVAYGAMIRGLCLGGRLDDGVRLFNDMLAREEPEPDAVIYNILFDGLLKGGKLTQAMDLLRSMLNRGCDPDEVTCNTFLREFGGDDKKVREFMEGLVVRLSKRERVEGAAGIVGVMLAKNVAPEPGTWAMVLGGVCNGRRVRRLIDKCWIDIGELD